MKKFLKKTDYLSSPAILLYKNHLFAQRFLGNNEYFENYKKPDWRYRNNPSFTVENENVHLMF